MGGITSQYGVGAINDRLLRHIEASYKDIEVKNQSYFTENSIPEDLVRYVAGTKSTDFEDGKLHIGRIKEEDWVKLLPLIEGLQTQSNIPQNIKNHLQTYNKYDGPEYKHLRYAYHSVWGSILLNQLNQVDNPVLAAVKTCLQESINKSKKSLEYYENAHDLRKNEWNATKLTITKAENYDEKLLYITQFIITALSDLEKMYAARNDKYNIHLSGGGDRDTNITTVIILVVILLLIFHVFFMFVVKNTPISLLITVVITWIGYNYVTF